MKRNSTILPVFAAAIAGMLSIAGCSGRSSSDDSEVDLSGPLPALVADETTYNFGTMPAGTEKSHSFVIRNKGDAPLHIGELNLSCKCTKGTVAKKLLEPGESTTVDVTWQPERADRSFHQILSLVTNDPRYPGPGHFKLVIRGGVDQVVNVDPPQGEFKLGGIVEEQPTVVHGTIYSRVLDSFSILDIVKEHRLITAVATPLEKEQLEKLNAKCGYDVTVTLAPGIQVGPFKEKLTVKTDINQGTDLPWFISGERTGPFRIVAQGAEWSSEKMLLTLGQFSAEKGSKAQLKMLVSGLENGRELEFLDVHSDVQFVKLEMKAVPGNKTREQKVYSLTIEIPPGSPAAAYVGQDFVKIHVKTNHPKAEKMEFNVSFVSL